MKFFKLAKKFHEAEDGAVTVDWVVLTAALAAVKGGMKTLTGNINSQLSGQSINTTFD
jgi:hypothetical protein